MIGRPIEDLQAGESAELTRTFSAEAIERFVAAVGDRNPLHHDAAFAAETPFGRPIVPGILTTGLVSAVIGTELPGPGCVYISQEVRFLRPVMVGDTITARVEVVERLAERNRIRLTTVCRNESGEEVLTGEAWVKPPKQQLVYSDNLPAPALSAHPLAWGAAVVGLYSRVAQCALHCWRRTVAT